MAELNLLNLAQQDTTLKRRGKEWHGPCPLCGGRDRFWVSTNRVGETRWYCRQCTPKGGDEIAYRMAVYHEDFPTAARAAGRELDRPSDATTRPPFTPRTPTVAERRYAALDDPGWQRSASKFIARCRDALYTPDGAGARTYLREQRRLDDHTLADAGVGYNPRDYRAKWGDTSVWLPRGIVIPWRAGEQVITLRVRPSAPINGRKYHQPKGAANGLYNAEHIRPGCTVVLTEGEFDALLVQQVARDNSLPIVAAATGSIHGARRMEWIARLALAEEVFVAFDVETDPVKITQVEAAAGYWLEALGNAKRFYPAQHDITDMALAGDSIAAWLVEAVRRC